MSERKDLHEVSIKVSMKLIEVLGTEEMTKNLKLPASWYMKFNDECDLIVREFLGRIGDIIVDHTITSSESLEKIDKLLRLDV